MRRTAGAEAPRAARGKGTSLACKGKLEVGGPNLHLCSDVPAGDETIEDEQYDRAEDRNDPARSLVRPIEPHGPSDEATQQRASDAQQNRHDETAGVPSRHQELR